MYLRNMHKYLHGAVGQVQMGEARGGARYTGIACHRMVQSHLFMRAKEARVAHAKPFCLNITMCASDAELC